MCVDGIDRQFYIVCGQDAVSKIRDVYELETDTQTEWYECLFNIMLVCKDDNSKQAGSLIVNNECDTVKLDQLFNNLCSIYRDFVIKSLQFVYDDDYSVFDLCSYRDHTNQRLLTGIESVFPDKIRFKNGFVCDIDCTFKTNYLNSILLSEDVRFQTNVNISFALKRFYKGKIPSNVQLDELTVGMVYFLQPSFGMYQSALQNELDDILGSNNNSGSGEGNIGEEYSPKLVQFADDGRYIYCAFLEQYNIDLQCTEYQNMHWWRFQTLLSGLHDTKFNDIIQIRQIQKPTANEKKLQRQFKLPIYPKVNVYETFT